MISVLLPVLFFVFDWLRSRVTLQAETSFVVHCLGGGGRPARVQRLDYRNQSVPSLMRWPRTRLHGAGLSDLNGSDCL